MCSASAGYFDRVLLGAYNKSLQRSGTHKVLGRGRPSKSAHERWRARVLKWRRAAAELGR
jgi:hypothetical protein